MSHHHQLAPTPPMGWNSWDCFGVSVTEAEVRQNAEFIAERLKRFGWEYVVVDLCWFAPEADTANYKRFGLNQLIDRYGRLIPDPVKFPSSADGAGFKPLADYVHSLGLKLGVHLMRGMPWQAADRNTPIKGSTARAADIAQPADRCLWYANTYGVNCTRDGAQAYYDSVAQLLAEWQVDLLKMDDMNSWDGEGNHEPYHTDEVEAVRTALDRCGRPIVLSLSPGAARLCNAKHLRDHANLWRVSFDFWDEWPALHAQFARLAQWAPYTAPGAWPDADMIPIGRIGIRGEVGEARETRFTEPEQRTLMTLWCIARSPLMLGCHLPETGEFALSLFTNPGLLAINQHSTGGRQAAYEPNDHAVWTADGPGGESYVAQFNLSDQPQRVDLPRDLADRVAGLTAHDIWTGANAEFDAPIEPHGVRLVRV
ncbi:Alpha-galactosidase A precursor [Pirellulimonas nuda]|uniref:Alpha-galactosidase n=1 Tax=Pirellulimonas nuda TaxID=2528009 RepID=A0A518D5A9_9BACT|nr:glycoside hydrolase family 27 protein [Pirellulimonas nuda]QDU86662.1 Alpha-galactosidase A precursor [Pirellulimonas nuda]